MIKTNKTTTDAAMVSSEAVVRRYYAICRSGCSAFDAEGLRAILAPDLVFEGPIAGHRVGVESFVQGVTRFVQGTRRIDVLHDLHDADHAASLYDAELPGGTVRFAEFLEVRDGRIASLRLIYDPAEFRARGGH